jgi:hypothetical protein
MYLLRELSFYWCLTNRFYQFGPFFIVEDPHQRIPLFPLMRGPDPTFDFDVDRDLVPLSKCCESAITGLQTLHGSIFERLRLH